MPHFKDQAPQLAQR